MHPDRNRELTSQHRWNVPTELNIATAVCGRQAADRARFAMYWEDESGETAALTFWDLQQQANRLSNALAALGVGRSDRVAIILPQRPETAIAHIACYQMGAVAVPLSFLFGPEALDYRLRDAEVKVALVDAASLPNLASIRLQLPALRHVIGVAGAHESWMTSWEALLAKSSRRYSAVATRADDPALIIYTSGTTGPPKGALMPHRCLLGNLPGFVCPHDGFPRDGDVFSVAGGIGPGPAA